MRRRLAALAGVMALACGGVALAACGIPTEATARALSNVPAKVNEPLPVTSTTALPTQAGDVTLTVFFISTDAYLVAEPRYVKPPASVATAIETLLAGPTTHELYTEGLTSALASDIKLLHTYRVGTVATVNFTTHFGSLSGNQEVLGVAQVVFTVAGALQPSIGVLFEINGDPIPVPVASGGLTSSPVHESDYASLRPQTSGTRDTTP